MEKFEERRKEPRLRYQLPVSFGEDLDKSVSKGVMSDISSRGMAFTCPANENCPTVGQQLTVRYSIPLNGADDCSDMKNFTRTGQVCRIDNLTDNHCRIAIVFDQAPPFWDKPANIK